MDNFYNSRTLARISYKEKPPVQGLPNKVVQEEKNPKKDQEEMCGNTKTAII